MYYSANCAHQANTTVEYEYESSSKGYPKKSLQFQVQVTDQNQKQGCGVERREVFEPKARFFGREDYWMKSACVIEGLCTHHEVQGRIQISSAVT